MTNKTPFNFGAFRDAQIGNKRENTYWLEADEGRHKVVVTGTKADPQTKKGKAILVIELAVFDSETKALGQKRTLFANMANTIQVQQMARAVLNFCRVDTTSLATRIEGLRALGCTAGDSKTAKVLHESTVDELLAEGEKVAEGYAGQLAEDLLGRFFAEGAAIGMVAEIEVALRHKEGKTYPNAFVQPIDEDLEALVATLKSPDEALSSLSDADRAAAQAEINAAMKIITKAGVPVERLRVGL